MSITHRYTRPDQYYLMSAETYGYPPYNSTSDDLPPGPWPRKWPQYITGEGWVLVEDHRARTAPRFAAEDIQEPTDYWLPAEGDDWQSQPRHMKDIGPLPEGAVTDRPEKPVSAARAEKLREIDAGYESALVAALTMPDAAPTPMTVSVETAALLAVDPDAVDSIRAVLDTRRADLRAAVEAAATVEEVEAVVVNYPV